MCGIIGIFSKSSNINLDLLSMGIESILVRGRDGIGIEINGKMLHFSNIYDLKDSEDLKNFNGKSIIIHILHAVVNHISQPLNFGKGTLVANCEIYNWKTLNNKLDFKDKAKNDSEMLLYLMDSKKEVNNELLLGLDGDFALAYKRNENLWLARDLIGVKPLWYAHSPEFFAFASERKALLLMGFDNPQELNPRKILHYRISENSLNFYHREFYNIEPVITDEIETVTNNLTKLLEDSCQKRVPKVKLGLLFSGGIDSVILAQLLKNSGVEFTCFVTGLGEKSSDLIWSRKAAELMDLDLEEIVVNQEDIDTVLPQVINILEESTVVKVEIAIPIFLASKRAKEKGIRVIISGMGADELFGGYYRQRISQTFNLDCLSAIRGTYERNTYRDDTITMSQSIELRVPYLDKFVIDYSLRIPEEYKLRDEHSKYILRMVAKKIGVPDELVWRPKKAAQYGSKVDSYLKKKAKSLGITRFEYFSGYLKYKSLRLGVLFSTGKDSSFAMHVMKKRGYKIACLITIQSENLESYMFHTPAINVADYQAESLNLPLIIGKTVGNKEEELKDLFNTIQSAKEKYKLDGIITGALYSNYQRTRIEKIADSLNLKTFNPLWHIDQEREMRQLLREDFTFIFTAVAAYGLDKSWLGRPITEKDIDKLVEYEKKVGLNVAGEGGEFESLVLDMPGFTNALEIIESEIVETGSDSCYLDIKKIKIVDKKKSKN